MDKLHQDILKKLRENIVEDLDVYNGVIYPLITEYILKDEDIKAIEQGATKQKKATVLLDLLPHRGSFAFDVFHQALRHHYWWLSESMDILLKSHEAAASDIGCHCTNIPPISPLTVTRKKKLEKLKDKLKKLKPNDYIALHGMKGFGKSCLTASTLKDKSLVCRLFNNQIYWIKFGYERPISEEILIQLNNLYHQIKQCNISPELTDFSHLKESLKFTIENYFRKEAHRNALLILEDVCKEEIIDAFNFDCKTLVITTDISVLRLRHPTIIEMNDGFTEAETLGLFAQVLNMEVSKLPVEARLIHKECKGMPLLIAMFTAQFEQFKHDMQINSKRWRYYLECLRKKNSKNSVMKEFLEKQEATFKMCIDQLPEDLKNRYQTLAIFSEDVNIKPMTLEIMWEEENPFHVEELMLYFCHKSLAAKKWNDEAKSYIYGVHDLLLSYLRKTIAPETLREMHRSFIEKCRKFGGGSLSKLPTDNYTYSYIGHHLEQAQLYDEFPKLYFDFDFLQAKINNIGLGDLFIDLDKYRKYITKYNDHNLVSRVADLQHFLRHNESILAKQRNRQCLDLVQIGMNHSEDGYVKKKARELAMKRSTNLYLSLEKKLQHADTPSSEELLTKISVARFTDDPDEILIGDENGNIFLWNCTIRNQTFFHGHDRNSVIRKIVLSADGHYFLSLSDDGMVKLFALNQDEFISPNSPRQRQDMWQSIFHKEDDSIMTITVFNDKVSDITFGHNDETIVACTLKGCVEIWDRNGVSLLKTKNAANNYLEKISFTNMKKLLHTLNSKEGVIVIYGLRDGSYTYVSQFNMTNQSDMKIVFASEYNSAESESTMIIVTEKKVFFFRWYSSCEQIHSFDLKAVNVITDKYNVYTCAALTYDDKYLILADSAGNVNVWRSNALFEPVATYKAHISSVDTYWMEQEAYHLICGSENRVIHRWKLEVEKEATTITNPAFTAIMKPYGQEDFVVKETFSSTIIMMSDEKVLYESPRVNEKIEKLLAIEDGNKIVYVTDKNTVAFIERNNQKGTFICNIAKANDLVAVTNICNKSAIICREDVMKLKIWRSDGHVSTVEGAGDVITIYEISENIKMMVNRTSILTFWDIKDSEWKRIHVHKHDKGTSTVNYSCLSSDKAYLAIVKENKDLSLFLMEINKTVIPAQFNVDQFWTTSIQYSPSCCEFSSDGKYLAVGMDNGDISIITVFGQIEMRTLSFHLSPVEQLHWCPASVGVSVLLSVNRHEMVFWNVTLMSFRRTQNRRSRMGISRSISSPSIGMSPRSSLTMSGSLSNDLKTLSLFVNGFSGNDVNVFWKLKVGNDPDKPELLGIVPLPPTGTGKVFVSEDFMKFLTIDAHGFISKYRLFNFP